MTEHEEAAPEQETGSSAEIPKPIEIPPPAPATPQARVPRALVMGLVALTVVVIVLAVLFIVAESDLSNEHALDSARTSALAAARLDASALASYDYRDLPAHFRQVEAGADPKFAKKFESTSGALEKVLAQYHAVARCTIVSAGVVSVSTTKAQVAVFLDQTVTNSQNTTPTTDRSRVLVTLVRPGSTWLLDQLEVL